MFGGCHRRGGVERSVYEAARHFSRDHDVTVYAAAIEHEGLERVVKRPIQVPSRSRSLRPILFARAAREALRDARHDHVISFGASPIGADVLWVNSVHAAWLERRDVFAGDRLRSSPLRRYLPRHQVILALERQYFVHSRDALLVAVSDQVIDDLARLYGFPRTNAAVIHNGFDPQEFAPGDPHHARIATRREIGLPEDSVVLLLVANELTRKGLPVLVDAVAQLESRDIHILLVGRASPDPYLSYIARAGLSERFHYGGSRADMGRVHAASDIFVLPTRYEAFSLAVVEALASGLPVITTDVAGARDLVIDGVNGRIQKNPIDAAELAAILGEALDARRYVSWASHAADSVRAHTWGSLFDRALELIAALPERRTRAGSPS